jgi:uncharacterized membrane protein
MLPFRYSVAMQIGVEPARPVPTTCARIQSVDLLRGLVMAIMALDHIREFFHTGAFHYSPEDLSKTTGILFSLAGSPTSARRYSCF